MKYLLFLLLLVGCEKTNIRANTIKADTKFSIRQCIDSSTGRLCRDSYLLDKKLPPLDELDICFYLPYSTGGYVINISCSDYEKIKARGIKE